MAIYIDTGLTAPYSATQWRCQCSAWRGWPPHSMCSSPHRLTGRLELVLGKIVSCGPTTKAIAVSKFRKKFSPSNWIQGVTLILRKIWHSWAAKNGLQHASAIYPIPPYTRPRYIGLTLNCLWGRQTPVNCCSAPPPMMDCLYTPHAWYRNDSQYPSDFHVLHFHTLLLHGSHRPWKVLEIEWCVEKCLIFQSALKMGNFPWKVLQNPVSHVFHSANYQINFDIWNCLWLCISLKFKLLIF